jgi:hypothetical protein
MEFGDSSGRQPRFRLLDQQLRLDPEILRMMREIEARLTARQMVNLFLQPDWQLQTPLWQTWLTQPKLAPQRPSAMQYVPGAGPSTPRPGEVADVARAVYQLPAVQRLVLQAHDEGIHQLGVLRREWESGSTADRAVMVSMSGLVVGSSLTIILANQQTRVLAFDLIKGREIPVPGVRGLSFQLLDQGGAVRAPLGVPGLSGSARLQFPTQRPDFEVTVSFDVMEFVRSRN